MSRKLILEELLTGKQKKDRENRKRYKKYYVKYSKYYYLKKILENPNYNKENWKKRINAKNN